MDTHMDTRGSDSQSRYRDDCSPESVFNGHKVDYGKIEYNKDTIEKHSNECPEIGVPASSRCMRDPASVMRGDSDTVQVLTPRVDNIEFSRLPDHNDKDRKWNGDGMVTSLRHETHMSCESTDILADNTYQATYPWCGGVRENVMDTHKDIRGPNSHSRCHDDHSN